MKKIYVLLLSAFIISCSSSSGTMPKDMKKLQMRGVEADSQLSSIIISVNRELRVGYEYFLKGEFQKALRVYKKAAREYMKFDYRHRLATVYSNIGTIYLKINQLDKARDYISLSLKLGNENILGKEERDKLKAVNLYKLALVNIYEDKSAKAKKLNDVSFKINSMIFNLKGLAQNYRVYALLHNKKKEYKKAASVFATAITFNQRSYDYYNLVLNRLSLGDVYLKLKEHNKSLYYYNLGLRTAKQREYSEKISIALYKIGNLFEKKKDYKKALEYFKRAHECDLNLDLDEDLRKVREARSIEKVKEMYLKLNKAADYQKYTEIIKFFYYNRLQE
jgi:tetratricopeptide (TPR) repeat protein